MPPFAFSFLHRKHVWIAGGAILVLLGQSMLALAPHRRQDARHGSKRCWIPKASWLCLSVEPAQARKTIGLVHQIGAGP